MSVYLDEMASNHHNYCQQMTDAQKQVLSFYQDMLDDPMGIDNIYMVYELLKTSRISCVYFIRNLASDLVKIGRTKNLKYRYATIRNDVARYNQGKVKLERIILSPESQLSKLENIIHKHYKNLRKNGEWFDIQEKYDDEYCGTNCILCNSEGDTELVVDDLYDMLAPVDIKKNFVDSLNRSGFIETLFDKSPIEALNSSVKFTKLISMINYVDENKIQIRVLKYGFYDEKIKEYVGRYACLGDSENVYDIQRAYEDKINTLVKFIF